MQKRHIFVEEVLDPDFSIASSPESLDCWPGVNQELVVILGSDIYLPVVKAKAYGAFFLRPRSHDGFNLDHLVHTTYLPNSRHRVTLVVCQGKSANRL